MSLAAAADELLPWKAVHEQTQRGIRAGVFEAMTHNLRIPVWVALEDRAGQPTAAIIDRRTVQSTPESGARAGYDGHKRRKGSKVHIAVDTLGCLLALKVTAAREGIRLEVVKLPVAKRGFVLLPRHWVPHQSLFRLCGAGLIARLLPTRGVFDA